MNLLKSNNVADSFGGEVYRGAALRPVAAAGNVLSQRLSGRRSKPRGRQRSGFSLLEVILAIVIFGSCLAVLGELVRVGARSAQSARGLATAQLVCESMMAEIDAGITQPTATEGTVDYVDGSQWSFTLTADPVDQEGLLEIVILVQQDGSVNSRPVSCSLTRWMIDPQLIADLQAYDDEMSAAQADASGSASDGSGDSTASASSAGASSTPSAPAAGGGR